MTIKQLSLHSSSKISSNFDDYEIDQMIGRGGYSMVFNGQNLVTGAPVIIKVLNHGDHKKYELRR